MIRPKDFFYTEDKKLCICTHTDNNGYIFNVEGLVLNDGMPYILKVSNPVEELSFEEGQFATILCSKLEHTLTNYYNFDNSYIPFRIISQELYNDTITDESCTALRNIRAYVHVVLDIIRDNFTDSCYLEDFRRRYYDRLCQINSILMRNYID